MARHFHLHIIFEGGDFLFILLHNEPLFVLPHSDAFRELGYIGIFVKYYKINERINSEKFTFVKRVLTEICHFFLHVGNCL